MMWRMGVQVCICRMHWPRNILGQVNRGYGNGFSLLKNVQEIQELEKFDGITLMRLFCNSGNYIGLGCQV